MPDWQPIATAPKDGTRVLVWKASVFLAHWELDFSTEWDEEAEVSKSRGAWTDGTVKSWNYQEEQEIENPTHWMPLPDPPAQDEGGKK